LISVGRQRTNSNFTVSNKYGNTWWGQQWLNALSNIDFSNRLPRGRTYANKGRVSNIQIKENRFSADVQGSEYAPYFVNFTLPEFSKNDKANLIELVTNNLLILTKLLNRELPIELKQSCDHYDIELFPDSWQDMRGSCDCPDRAVPCKHMAAVLYLIANEIDKNPFLVFQLHGFDLFAELEKEGYTAQGQKEIAILSAAALQQSFDKDRDTTEWDDGVFQQLDFSRLPECRENLMTILTEKPTFYPKGDFKKILDMAYAAVAKKLSKVIKKPEEEPEVSVMDQVEDGEVLLNEQMAFVNATMRNANGKIILSFDAQKELMDWLNAVPISAFNNFSPALKSLRLLYQFAVKLLQKSAVVPQLIRIGKSQYKVRWMPALLNPVVRSIHDGVQSIVANDLLFYKDGKKVNEPIDADKVPALISLFLNYLMQQHHGLVARFGEHEMGHLFFNGALLKFQTYESKAYPAAIQLWLNKLFISDKNFVPVLQVDDEGDEGFLVSVGFQDKSEGMKPPIPLQQILEEDQYQPQRMEALRDLSMLSDYFPAIKKMVASKGRDQIFFGPDEFVPILFKIIPTIRLFGIKVLLPKALRKLFRPRLTILLGAKEETTSEPKKKSVVNMGDMLHFQWRIAMGDQQLTEQEFTDLIKEYSGIVKLNEDYIFFDENEIKALIAKLKSPPPLPKFQMLKAGLTETYEGAKIALDDNAKQLMARLRKGEGVSLPTGLKATLRPYQLSGYEWMYKNSKLGFGSLIADDMGLGKTLQIITILLKLKEDGALKKQKGLVVVPTTLLTNWEKEIQRFAPDLRVHTYHGSKRKMAPLAAADILLTTYGVARTESALLQKLKWHILVIDEAQNIKNPGTAQTKAIKKIKATIKIAMSGTPVENRLSEYWSIFDFTNKGYLDSLPKFKENFIRPIEVDRNLVQLDKFRSITEPFILRRLKSDKSIIKDLPEKIEKDQYCELSPSQTAIYQNVVNSTMKAIKESEGIARKGLVLKLITTLKQVCNHPRQFLKKGPIDPELSGKTQLLFKLIHEIQLNNEKTLIFTQYQEMGKILAEMLEQEFNFSVPFLHGGVSRKGRDQMVSDFQNNRATRILILSLKAGGTGLNLTQASNVIHFDLWWNPAVEAQATDRAYRIGQKRNVLVHRFITQGTFEEKINELLLTKKDLANLTVATGEKWIGEFSDSELASLVAL